MHADLGRLLDVQCGVVTSAQALTFLTRRGLEARVNQGSLHKIWYGIYGLGEVTTELLLRGLDLACGKTVVACMGTAAAAYGFDTERTADVHVRNPDGRQLRSTDGLVVHRRAGAPLTELGWAVVPIVAEDVRNRPGELTGRLATQLRRAA
jgi:hypothetical protein